MDFVLLWVDGSDEAWLREKMKYKPDESTPDKAAADAAKCFRDWGTLKYWFRGVETCAPWVRKIHFVTWGHLPPWLNIEHPKLHIVNHRDFMPEGSLPTFNSQALEMNLHRIPDLAGHFVYFNDDTFLIGRVRVRDFFEGGLPRDCALMTPVFPERFGTGTVQINNMEIVNAYFGGISAVFRNKSKWFAPCYGPHLFRTLLLLPFRRMCGFYEPHLPNAFLKSTFETVWEKEADVLLKTSRSRFRQKDNVNQWLMRYWQLMSGNFAPRNPKIGQFFDLSGDMDAIERVIKKRGCRMLCLNDSDAIADMEARKERLLRLFEELFPKKSDYER
ncbi:MAG: stealth family protein [Lachnospiraceae bacterium]|nr:stealth family protein [Lachnospiraceae bacterium]